MKKIGLFLLAVVMMSGLAGCKSRDKDADPVGTWVTTYDWGCDGGSAISVDHYYSNGSYIDSDGNTGNWSVDKNSLTLNYADGTIYSGTISGGSIAGTMVAARSGETGCWSSTRTSTTP